MNRTRIIALALALCLMAALLTGCASRPVVKIDGMNIPAGYYIYNYCMAYTQDSGTGSSDAISNKAMENIMRYCIVEKLCKQYGIQLEALERKPAYAKAAWLLRYQIESMLDIYKRLMTE